jgi:hypothetical protein
MESTRLQPLPTRRSELRDLSHEARRIAATSDEPDKTSLGRLADELAEIADRLDRDGAANGSE